MRSRLGEQSMFFGSQRSYVVLLNGNKNATFNKNTSITENQKQRERGREPERVPEKAPERATESHRDSLWLSLALSGSL